MSILKRTGTRINDVAYQDGIAAGQKVFTKDQKWATTAAGETYNCLHRTGSGVADVAYQNETIGKPLSSYSPGSIIKIKESGVDQDWIVLKHGYPVSNGTILRRRLFITNQSTMTSDGELSYEGSQADEYYRNNFLPTIEDKVRNKLITVNITVNHGRTWAPKTIPRNIYILSATELQATGESYPSQGSPIEYFNSDSRRIGYRVYSGGERAVEYGTRTPGEYISSYGVTQIRITTSGKADSMIGSSRVSAPVIVLPSNTVINEATGGVL